MQSKHGKAIQTQSKHSCKAPGKQTRAGWFLSDLFPVCGQHLTKCYSLCLEVRGLLVTCCPLLSLLSPVD